MTIVAFPSRAWKSSPAINNRYRVLSTHLSIAMRLRGFFAPTVEASRGTGTTLDAIFDPEGKCYYAREIACENRVLEEIRGAIRARECARSSLRHRDPDQALALWKSLVCGSWSLIDRYESDGRRFVVAVRNDDGLTDPRTLTKREAVVVQRARCGASNKEIAFKLGISEGCVSAHLHSAYRKLKCTRRSDLIQMTSSANEEMILAFDNTTIGVIAEPEARESPSITDRLTPTECAVLKEIRSGLTNAEIARNRGTSPRTIANQVAMILRKTSRYSRFELMLDSVPDQHESDRETKIRS